jgi:hypothetical protein
MGCKANASQAKEIEKQLMDESARMEPGNFYQKKKFHGPGA